MSGVSRYMRDCRHYRRHRIVYGVRLLSGCARRTSRRTS
jgi:hypothetical protein